MTQQLDTDIVIFGGGIAGLWLINLLREHGYSCVLLERDTLGGGQTLLSQGIIHGGLKYALGGALSRESEAIAGMPDRWRAHLAGHASPDLSRTRVLSGTQHLWSSGSAASRFTTFFASRMLRGRIHRLGFDDFPPALKSRRFRGSVYRMDDLVVDTESLLDALITPLADRLLQFRPDRHAVEWDEAGVRAIHLDGLTIRPRLTVLAAGAGNGPLLADAHRHQLALSTDAQLRPLQMVLVRHRPGVRLYAHCIGTSSRPRLTVTTHEMPDGSLVWYLGGELAEKGVEMTAGELVAAARHELAELFPWLDFSDADFAAVRVDRAEPRQHNLLKPDHSFACRERDLVVTWPTKLTLAPDLGDRVLELLGGWPAAVAEAEIPEAVPRARRGTPVWKRLWGAAP